jgi:hypothetical protein
MEEAESCGIGPDVVFSPRLTAEASIEKARRLFLKEAEDEILLRPCFGMFPAPEKLCLFGGQRADEFLLFFIRLET